MTSRVYLLIALVFYAVGGLRVVVGILTRARTAFLTPLTAAATLAGFVAHTAGLSQRWTEAGRFPAVGLHDLSSLMAWAIVLVFLMTYLWTRIEALGLLAYPGAFGLMVVANLVPVSAGDAAIPASVFLPVHTTLAVLGYGAFFVAFTMGALYLIQEAELKARSPRTFYYLIPSLERCDTIGGRSVTVGFAFLTLAILTGLFWSQSAHGHYWSGDPKEWSALLAWCLYIVLIVTRYRTGWGGRRAAVAGMAGFAAMVFTFAWTLSRGPGAG